MPRCRPSRMTARATSISARWPELSDEEFERSSRCSGRCRGGCVPARQRFFADGGFFTADRKARFIAPEPPALTKRPRLDYPFRLNTGRIRDQWHTMTRTGMSPRLATHLPEPFVEIHPTDASAAGLTDGGCARVATATAPASSRSWSAKASSRAHLFVPIHWSGETASGARIGDLVAPCTDPYSGQPEAKATPAAISNVSFQCMGLPAHPTRSLCRNRLGGHGSRSRAGGNTGSRPIRVRSFWHDFAYREMTRGAPAG